MTTFQSSQVPQQAKGFIPSWGLPHVLVVDDNEDIAEMLGLLLESLGYRVSTANDGHAALRISDQETIDALITDFRMPGMNGQELVALMRAGQPDLPAVIVSGYTWEIPKYDCQTKIVSKPVSMPALMEIIRGLLSED